MTKAAKTITYAAGIFTAFWLIIAFLITSVEAVAYWTPGYYEKEYTKYQVLNDLPESCHKRPVSSDQITKMIDEIEKQIFSMEEREIPSVTIGELVMKKLKMVDEVAYVRFASVYREFKDVNAFMDELAKFLNNK